MCASGAHIHVFIRFLFSFWSGKQAGGISLLPLPPSPSSALTETPRNVRPYQAVKEQEAGGGESLWVPHQGCFFFFFLGAQTFLHIRGFTWGGCLWSPREAEVHAREGLTQESDRVPEASTMTPDARRGGPALSSLRGLWSLSVCAASRLSCLMRQKARQGKENEFFARLVSRISLFLRASWREAQGLCGLGSGREKAMCRQKITLLGGADYLGWLSQSRARSICSWVPTKMQTQWSLSCRETMLICLPLSSAFWCGFSLQYLFGGYSLLSRNSVETASQPQEDKYV